MSFFFEYLKQPTRIGAIAPSSRWLAKKMIAPIDFATCDVIVEYGPGTGVFTKEVIKRKKKETLFLIIEQNAEFYRRLKKKYLAVPNLILINGSAEHLEQYLNAYHVQHVSYIISGLPFAALPESISERILAATQKAIGTKGRFITFQYTLLKCKFFQRYFGIKEITLEFKNIPPAYVLTMMNRPAKSSSSL